MLKNVLSIHIIFTFAHFIHMVPALCVLLASLMSICLLFQWKIAVKTHFTLSGGRLIAELSVFGMRIVSIKLIAKDGLRIFVNGKQKQPKRQRISSSALNKLLTISVKNKLIERIELAALVGTRGAGSSALLCALINMLPILQVNAYRGYSGEKCDMDIRIKISVSTLTLIRLYAIMRADKKEIYAEH